MKYYFSAFRKYAVFSGRAGLTEFWMFVVFNILFSVTAYVVDVFMGFDSRGLLQRGIISEIYLAITFIPGTALAVRRLHDVGKDGWFLWVVVIPFLGVMWFFKVAMQDSYPVKNIYGDVPKNK